MITGMTKAPPLAVSGKAIPEDYGTDKSSGGISTKVLLYSIRAQSSDRDG